MKQKIGMQQKLSMFLALVMFLTTVLAVPPQMVVQATEKVPTIVKTGADSGGSSKDSTTENLQGEKEGQGQDVVAGKTISYVRFIDTAYANTLWDVDFEKAGVYKISFLAAVKTAVNKFHIEYGNVNDTNWETLYEGSYFDITEKDESDKDNYCNYVEFNSPDITVNIPEAGKYAFKIGSWDTDWSTGSGVTTPVDFKIAEVRFDYIDLDSNEYDLSADESLTIFMQNPIEGADGSADYILNVAEAGDYTLTYFVNSMGGWSETGMFEPDTEGIQYIVNPDSDDKVEGPKQKLTHFYNPMELKQTVSLEAGTQTLRIQTLADKVAITKIVIDTKKIHTVSKDETTAIPANQFTDSNANYYAIENGAVGYASAGLEITYDIDVEEEDVYSISYNYQSSSDTTLVTKIDGRKVKTTNVEAASGDGNWYDTEFQDTASKNIELTKGHHTLTIVWGAADLNVKSLSLKPVVMDPVIVEVPGTDGASGAGAWNMLTGQETDNKGNVVKYAYPSTDQWANGRWNVELENIGTYKIQFVMAVPTVPVPDAGNAEWDADGFLFEYELKGTTTSGDSLAKGYDSIKNPIRVEQTASNEYKTFDGPELDVDEPGIYDIKFGTAVAGADWKLAKIILTCEKPKPSTDDDDADNVNDTPWELVKGEGLTLTEKMAFAKEGSLNRGVVGGNYVDYFLDVKESGEYVLLYSLDTTGSSVSEAFQAQIASWKEDMTDADFTTKLRAMDLGQFYDPVQEKQAVHLDSGKYMLRVRALASGFTVTQVDIQDAVVAQIPENDEVKITAVNYNDSKGSHAIQGSSIGYTTQDLDLDYTVETQKGGIYTLSYNYQAAGNYKLTAQRVMKTEDGESVIELAVSDLPATKDKNNWYESTAKDTEPVSILLPEGITVLRVHWNQADVNLISLTLNYGGSAVEYVKGLLNNLPSTDEMTLEDEAAVVKARASYNAITDVEKTEVGTEGYEKLQAAERQIEVLKLAKVIEDSKKALEKEFANYKENEYRTDYWVQVKEAKETGITAIEEAATAAEAQAALQAAKAAMAAVRKLPSVILVGSGNTAILAQSKAYRREGFLNSNVTVGNYADYYVNVAEAGEYIFTYALYSDEAVENAFAVKHAAGDYPEDVTAEYTKVSVPKVEMEGNLVKELRYTVRLEAGAQTIRFEMLSDKVRLNRITICKKSAMENAAPEEREIKVINANSFTDAEGRYMIVGDNVVAEAGTSLDYPVSVKENMDVWISYTYAGSKGSEITISKVDADGTVTQISKSSVFAALELTASEQEKIKLPKGNYALRITTSEAIELADISLVSKKISLNAYQLVMEQGDTFQLQAILRPEGSSSAITWLSSDETIVEVDANGKITAIKEGTAVITAAADGKEAVCNVTVGKYVPEVSGTAPALVKRVSIDISSVLYCGGDQNTEKIALLLPTGAKLKSVEYKSMNTKVATVENGLVTAKTEGTAKIEAAVTLTNGEKQTFTKDITVKKAYIELAKKSYSVKKRKSVNVKAIAYGSSKKVTFSIKDKKSKKCARISKAGKLTGKAKGTVKVVAKSGNVKLNFKVKVK